MSDAFDVPEAYQTAFRRLKRRMTPDMQTDRAVLETALLYLKLGGEKLAIHRLGLYRQQFETECKIFRRRLTEDALDDEEGEEDGGEEGEPSENEASDE